MFCCCVWFRFIGVRCVDVAVAGMRRQCQRLALEVDLVPSGGWVKLSTDGAVLLNGFYAGIWGMFRDVDANWLWGFSMLLGKDTIFKIEARTILESFHLAWQKGIRQLEIESDNALLIETIVEGGAADSQMMELRGIHQMVCRWWKICFLHISRTHNSVANHMANVTVTRFIEAQVFEVPPHSVRDLVQANYIRFTGANVLTQ
ncbi:hypothetical protein Goklo_024974 [Gossypium klotzschianum]|uniref:RNase H type-1 domain-containing protein n=1 Tax=Gossypium klotzschianum TaxID=34286 RepID=A0A7J8WA53_9ROSI|nr:hypothetical protein [Gossypium klotzschianum]